LENTDENSQHTCATPSTGHPRIAWSQCRRQSVAASPSSRSGWITLLIRRIYLHLRRYRSQKNQQVIDL
jgi:hypothetical protein